MFTKSALFELNIIPTGARSAPEKKSVLFVCLCNFYFSQTENPYYFDGCHYFYFLVSTNVSLFISIIISTGAPERSIQNMCAIRMCMLFILFARSRITAISTELLFLLFGVDAFAVITTFSLLLLFQLEFMILFR